MTKIILTINQDGVVTVEPNQIDISAITNPQKEIKPVQFATDRDTNPDDDEHIIPFDIERWRSGDFVRVQTRDGREVEELKEFKCVGTPLVALIEGQHGVVTYGIDGGFFIDDTERPEDLMLVVKGGGE